MKASQIKSICATFVMGKKDISIVTMSRARPDDYELHRAALRELAALGLPTVITDGGSGDEFLSYLNSFPNFIAQRAARAGAFLQIKASFEIAQQFATPYVLYTEPDKQFFFRQRLAEFIEQASSGDTTGIIMPARTAESFSSYPESQRFTEAFTNQLCGRIVKGGDFCYGPMLIRRSLVPYLSLLDGEIGWGWRPFLCGVARRLKLEVCQIELDLPCPIEQRADSESELFHRMRQLEQNVRGLNLSIALNDAQLVELSNRGV